MALLGFLAGAFAALDERRNRYIRCTPHDDAVVTLGVTGKLEFKRADVWRRRRQDFSPFTSTGTDAWVPTPGLPNSN
jgi:hypothetical protein